MKPLFPTPLLPTVIEEIVQDAGKARICRMRVKVVSISSNTNSFGLRGHILVARDGAAFEGGLNHLHNLTVGQTINLDVKTDLPLDRFPALTAMAGYGFEIPRRLPHDAPPGVLKKIWGNQAVRKEAGR